MSDRQSFYCRDDSGAMPLYYATWKQTNTELVEFLLEAGAEINPGPTDDEVKLINTINVQFNGDSASYNL